MEECGKESRDQQSMDQEALKRIQKGTGRLSDSEWQG